jgi:hypothetical protein
MPPTSAHHQLSGITQQDPDITLAELQSSLLMAHEVTCSTSGIDALLRRRGYT